LLAAPEAGDGARRVGELFVEAGRFEEIAATLGLFLLEHLELGQWGKLIGAQIVGSLYQGKVIDVAALEDGGMGGPAEVVRVALHVPGGAAQQILDRGHEQPLVHQFLLHLGPKRGQRRSPAR
jgi:hypothetical protein